MCSRPEGVAKHQSNFSCGSVTTVSCSNGYKLNGSSNLLCGPEGTFNNTSPVCVKQGEAFQSMPIFSLQFFPFQKIYRFILTQVSPCLVSFIHYFLFSLCSDRKGLMVLRIGRKASVLLLGHNEWRPDQNCVCVCVRVCDTLCFVAVCLGPAPFIEHAARSKSSDTNPVGFRVTYNCSDCYSGGGDVTCQENEQWSQAPKCTGIVQDTLSTDTHACNRHSCLFFLKKENGLVKQVCRSLYFAETTCRKPDGVTNTKTYFKCGSVTHVSCSSGYVLNGSGTLHCGTDGTFNSTSPVCVEQSNGKYQTWSTL